VFGMGDAMCFRFGTRTQVNHVEYQPMHDIFPKEGIVGVT